MRRTWVVSMVYLALSAGLVQHSLAWGWKQAPDPDDAMKFLNGTAPYTRPVTDCKVTALQVDGNIQYTVYFTRKMQAGSPGGWAWKKSNSPQDVLNFLNGAGGYTHAVKAAQVCAIAQGRSVSFTVFYQRGNARTPKNTWRWKYANTMEDAVKYLNGQGNYSKSSKHAQIASVVKNNKSVFYIFSQAGPKTQLQDHWRCDILDQELDVKTILDGAADYPVSKQDNKSLCSLSGAQGKKIYVFKPQGFVIVTRSMFTDALDAYIRWKQQNGFDVYVVTAEWIKDNVQGADLRQKIRNAIRTYYLAGGAKYVVLIGDSVDIPFPPYDATEYQEPPAPQLSEPWNLPAGYYHWEIWMGPHFSTLYYSDLNDKVYYSKNEYYWDGNYKIYVGLMPVRTVAELENILTKTIAYQPSKKMTFAYSADLYSDTVAAQYQAIVALGSAHQVTVDKSVFAATDSDQAIYIKVFESSGNIYEGGHGNVGIFKIGNTLIESADYVKFTHINPLFVASSCAVQSFQAGESLDEVFLKGPKGPVVVSASPPEGTQPPGTVWSEQTQGYWEDILAAKSVGQAMYDHCQGAWQNPINLFGDPSLPMVVQ